MGGQGCSPQGQMGGGGQMGMRGPSQQPMMGMPMQ